MNNSLETINNSEPSDLDIAKSVFADLTNELDQMKEAVTRIRDLQELLRGNPQLFQTSGFVWIGLLETAAAATGLNFNVSDSDNVFPDRDFIGAGSESVQFNAFQS